MTPQEQPDSQARDELYELIVSEVDSYAAPEYESYYPSIKENLIPQIEDYAERLATKARIDELDRLMAHLDTRPEEDSNQHWHMGNVYDYAEKREDDLSATLTKEVPDEQ